MHVASIGFIAADWNLNCISFGIVTYNLNVATWTWIPVWLHLLWRSHDGYSLRFHRFYSRNFTFSKYCLIASHGQCALASINNCSSKLVTICHANLVSTHWMSLSEMNWFIAFLWRFLAFSSAFDAHYFVCWNDSGFHYAIDLFMRMCTHLHDYVARANQKLIS